MKTSLWRPSAVLFVVALMTSMPSAWAQSDRERPDDSTADVEEKRRIEAESRAALRAGAAEAKETEGEKPEGEKDDPTYRLEWARKAWGVTTPTFRSHALKMGRDHSNRKHGRGPRWVNIGPTGADYEQNGSFTGKVRDSGRARTILAHPWDPDVVYFLTSGGGLWKTENWRSSRTRWQVLTDDLPTTGGGAVAFGRNPNTLYLGLGDPYDQILVGGAMVKTKNGGNTWSSAIELGNAVSVRDVKVDTSTNRDIVLVATDSGLYRSADDGQTYSPVATFADMSVWSIERTGAGWLASAQPCAVASVGLRCGFETTLFLSTDRGASWAPITNAGNVFAGNGRTTLGVAKPGENVVYAYSSNVTDAAMQDVYRSADGGQTWVANGVNATKSPTNPVTGMANMNICHGQCWYNQMILVDPQDAARNTVWIGGDLATARTTDGGVSWTTETWWLYSQFPDLRYAHADHHAAAFKTTGKPTLILGNDGGMNISTDNGATFSSDKNNGLVSHLFYTVAGSPDFPNLVIGGTQDNGTRLRTDNGTTYNQVIGGDGMGTAYSQENTNTVLGSAQGSSMRTNLSNTPPETIQSFVGATSGLTDVGFGFFTAIVPAPAGLDPTGRVFFHFSNARVWRTNNGGLNWLLIGSAVGVPSPGLPPARRFRSSPYNLGVSPTDLNRIAVGAAGGFLDITTDGGATWTDLDLITLVPGYQGFVTNVSWQDNQNLWITAVAQAPGAVRVIKATIANPSRQLGQRDLHPDAGRPSGSARHPGLLRSAGLDPGHDLRRHPRGHLPHHRRRRELGALRIRPSHSARQRHLHASRRRVHADCDLRTRHLGAAPDRAGERSPDGRRQPLRPRRRPGQRGEGRALHPAQEPGQPDRQQHQADARLQQPARDVPARQRPPLPAHRAARGTDRLHPRGPERRGGARVHRFPDRDRGPGAGIAGRPHRGLDTSR